MKIQRYESNLLCSNMYVVQENGHAIVIDPCDNLLPGEDLIIDMLIITHEHYDHISGVNAWKDRFNTTLMCSEKCAQNIESPRRNLARYFESFCEFQTWIDLNEIPSADHNYICSADSVFSEQAVLEWQGHSIKLIEIPGHSQGSIGIIIDSTDFFSGDSLMENHKIALGFPGGNERLWLEKGVPVIATLPKGIRIHPGHFSEFTLT